MADAVTVQAIAAAIEDEIAEDQLDLLTERPRTDAGQRVALMRRGPGRPLGARNKRTERTLAWLMSRYRDPREAMLALSDLNPHDFAAEFGCTSFEAVQEQRLIRQAVLPYVAQKQPLAIDLTSKRAVYLTIDTGAQIIGAGATGDGMSIAARIIEQVENQEVSDAANSGDTQPGDTQPGEGLDDER